MARHEFALFLSQPFARGKIVTINDPESLRRLTSVVRLREGENVQLFNREESIRGVVILITKKQIDLEVDERIKLHPLEPSLTILLPTLKKDDLEEALSRLCALGVTTIQLVETEKVQHSWQFDRERDRFERVMIAAAEQSKQLVLPNLLAPLSLEEALENTCTAREISKSLQSAQKNLKNAGSVKEICTHGRTVCHKIFFDPDGEKLMVVLELLVKTEGSTVLFVGPEGDLTDQEKVLIKQQGFIFCALTPTILRACEAIALGAGMVRSVVR
jgi:16S rRNA (uracil1498-N3)-methyltransferase